jgi:ethanolamine transporter EutH
VKDGYSGVGGIGCEAIRLLACRPSGHKLVGEMKIVWLLMVAIVVILAAPPALATLLLSLAFGSAAGMGVAGLGMSVGLLGVGTALYLMANKDAQNAFAWASTHTILGGYIGAALFFAIDAGLKLLME